MSVVEKFFEIFLKELDENQELRHYHRFVNSEKLYLFRRSYYQQRLEYIVRNIDKKDALILDLGCGYGTTSILLGFMGYKVIGTTIEYYYKEIANRLEFWKDYFDTSILEFKYENLFKSDYNKNTFDYIIVQDTLHHLEPIDEALKILNTILKDSGEVLVSEENGNNIINNIKNLKYRGFNRIVEHYDEELDETILFGNENTRSLSTWIKKFENNNLLINSDSVEYIRLLPPSSHRKHGMEEVIRREARLSKKSRLLREFLYFGINFSASKNLKV